MKNKVLVITPVKHIQGLFNKLTKIGRVKMFENISNAQFTKLKDEYTAIFTNPNKSKIFLGEQNLRKLSKLKVICTASTGTNHIDLDFCKKKNIKIISITKDKKIINKISSTAELAFALALSSIRNLIPAYLDVQSRNWDYEKFIGRQMNSLNIGIIGYGRLGKLFYKYCKSFKANVKIYDPFIKNKSKKFCSIKKLLKDSDLISLHIHSTNNHKFLNKDKFSLMKKSVIIINTSRGEIIDEKALVIFLKKNKKAKIATDVLSNEIKNKFSSILYKYSLKNKNQVIITPHIGGMTIEGQEMAYTHAVYKLSKFLK
jgi:D-3-phosphoglycerate dehydrogenase / 2-oxoglutarate reductase